MKKIIEFFLVYFFKFVLWFRYRIKVVGLDKLNKDTLNRPGGVLFLPNHPTVFVDPLIVVMSVWPKFSIRPMIVEYMYYMPIVNSIMRFLDALPIPNFTTTSNSVKRKKSEKVMQEVAKGLKNKENFSIAPAGKLKKTAFEAVGGASGVHRILQDAPEANVVMVRTKGLWGSSFSTYYLGRTPPMFETIIEGIKICLKNLLFFTPRREVIIEFQLAPKDFPYQGSRIEINKYLELWYNTPDGLLPQQSELPGDSLVLVSYSMWGEKYLEKKKRESYEDGEVDLPSIPEEIQEKVKKKLSELSDTPADKISPELQLSSDLGLDSLDTAEVASFLQDQFDVDGVPVNQLTSVGRVMGFASRQIVCKEEVEEVKTDMSKWKKSRQHSLVSIPEGETIPEVFLKSCVERGNDPACLDATSGVVTYSQLKLRTILLAEYIRHLPGEYIGILLPASVAATVTIMATQLAGKVPLLVNWTVGPRHLETVVKLSNVQVVLSSWAFLDRLENADLNGIEEKLLMLEDVRRELRLTDKLKAFFRSKSSVDAILRTFNADKLKKSSRAVLLFTSGTESMPKGVPLTYENILTDLRASLQGMDVYQDDILYGILPPFHAFGFSVSAVLGLICGVRVAYSPDPTDGKRLAAGFAKAGITIMVGAPTFVKGMLKMIKKEQIQTLRLCVTGAEKAPPELFKMMADLGKGDLFVEGYGITECAPVLSLNPLDGIHRGAGKPISCVELSIVHPETYQPIPLGSQGLILAHGPNIFAGYLNADVSSPFVELNGKKWYKTGDLGSLDQDGYLTISGRLKRFIKIGGEMVSLAAIEDALLQAGLRFGWPAADDGPALAICAKEILGEKPKIVLFAKSDPSVELVNQLLKDYGFSNLVKISSVVTLHEIPIMGSGKVNYRALEGKYLVTEPALA